MSGHCLHAHDLSCVVVWHKHVEKASSFTVSFFTDKVAVRLTLIGSTACGLGVLRRRDIIACSTRCPPEVPDSSTDVGKWLAGRVHGDHCLFMGLACKAYGNDCVVSTVGCTQRKSVHVITCGSLVEGTCWMRLFRARSEHKVLDMRSHVQLI